MSSYPPTDIRRGIALMVLTALLFIGVDSVAKHLTQRYSIVEVVWARFSALYVFQRERKLKVAR